MIRPKKKYLFLIVFVLGISTHSRLSTPSNNTFVTQSGIFISPAINIIQGNVSALDPVFKSLEMLETDNSEAKTVSIIHLGDSHIQAGYYSEALRKPLQQDFGSAGRGLITPLRISGTNEPASYLLTSPNRWESSKCATMNPQFAVGIGGIAIKTGSQNVEFNISSSGEEFSLVRLFHHPKAPVLQPNEELSTSIECPIYDTDLSTSIPLSKPVESVTLRSTNNDSDLNTPIFYGFSLENGNRGVLYHAIGVNGNNYEFTNRNPEIIEQSPLLAPNLIIISLGTNDSYGNFNSANIYNQICKLLASVKRANPNTPILLTTPMECYTLSKPSTRSISKINNNLPIVRDCIIKAAKEFKLPYWDFYNVAGGERAMEMWLDAELANPDKIHLTKEGYHIQGELLYTSIKEAYLKYLTN